MPSRTSERTGIPDADYHQNRFASALATLVQPGSRWLDLGAGSRIHGGWGGIEQRELAARASLLVGCELHAEHLRLNPFLTHRCLANGGALPFAADSFDLVSANMVVEHLEEPARVFTEVARVLAPGGRLAFVTPNRWHPAVWVGAVVVSRKSRRRLAHRVEGRPLEHVFPTFYRCNTSTAVERLARETGFVVEDMQLFSSFPFFRDGPAPARWTERLFLRTVRADGLRQFRSNLLAILRKPGG